MTFCEPYKFDVINKGTLEKLYVEFGLRTKEIGQIVGVTDGAIQLKLKNFFIPTNPRDKKRLDVNIVYTGKIKKSDKLSEEELLRLCKEGLTDVEIGEKFNMTGEGVAYRRKKFDIDLSIKPNEKQDIINLFKNMPIEILKNDYYNLTQEEFSNKYKISKTVWRPHLKALNIIGKQEKRIIDYPPFTKEQRVLIIGTCLEMVELTSL